MPHRHRGYNVVSTRLQNDRSRFRGSHSLPLSHRHPEHLHTSKEETCNVYGVLVIASGAQADPAHLARQIQHRHFLQTWRRHIWRRICQSATCGQCQDADINRTLTFAITETAPGQQDLTRNNTAFHSHCPCRGSLSHLGRLNTERRVAFHAVPYKNGVAFALANDQHGAVRPRPNASEAVSMVTYQPRGHVWDPQRPTPNTHTAG
jgi:hypothetical protein